VFRRNDADLARIYVVSPAGRRKKLPELRRRAGGTTQIRMGFAPVRAVNSGRKAEFYAGRARRRNVAVSFQEIGMTDWF
jgi:hypothetical protein